MSHLNPLLIFPVGELDIPLVGKLAQLAIALNRAGRINFSVRNTRHSWRIYRKALLLSSMMYSALVPFSYKRRGFCPSCGARRMLQARLCWSMNYCASAAAAVGVKRSPSIVFLFAREPRY
jgi:hypothetical protein